ncbi:MAG: hypothetical protein PVJ13_08435, partial [Desulfobacterales bacterium]
HVPNRPFLHHSRYRRSPTHRRAGSVTRHLIPSPSSGSFYLRLYSGGALWLAQSFVDLLLEFMSKGAGLVIGASLLSETIFSC